MIFIKLEHAIPLNERPREKALTNGVSSLSDRELLAIMLRNGYQGTSSLELADIILAKANGIGNLWRLNINDLISIKGIKHIKAIEILASFEFLNRMQYQQVVKKDVVSDPSKLYKWLVGKLGNQKQETFYVIFLDCKNQIIDYKLLFKGTLNASVVHPREIFKEAVLKSSSSIIIVHNHPSGDLKPSKSDIDTTNSILRAGELMNIQLVDHLIVSDCGYFSFLKSGMI